MSHFKQKASNNNRTLKTFSFFCLVFYYSVSFFHSKIISKWTIITSHSTITLKIVKNQTNQTKKKHKILTVDYYSIYLLNSLNIFPIFLYLDIVEFSDIMVIILGNGRGDTSSNPRRSWLDFTYHEYLWEKY